MNKLNGIILKVQTYRETSRLLQTFTEKGRITLLARGAERLNSNDRILAQYLTHIKFEYNEFKDFLTLKNGEIINDFANIKNDFAKTKGASIILEILDKATLGELKNEDIFELAIKALNYQDILVSALSFSLKMVYYLGYGINFKGDGRKIKGVNIKYGRIIYEEEKIEVDLNYNETIDLLKLTYTKIEDLEAFDNSFINKSKTFIKEYYAYHLNIIIKSLN